MERKYSAVDLNDGGWDRGQYGVKYQKVVPGGSCTKI